MSPLPPPNPPPSLFVVIVVVAKPLASILGDFTEEVSAHTNETLGGLIQATLGNAVEIVVSIQALYANQIRVVQVTAFVFCFFLAGGYTRVIGRKYPKRSERAGTHPLLSVFLLKQR